MPRKAAAPKEGQEVTVGDAGIVLRAATDDAEAITGGPPAGTAVRVLGVYPPGTPGVGDTDDGSDAVVIEWDEPGLVQGDDGLEVGATSRSMSVPASSWSDTFTSGGS